MPENYFSRLLFRPVDIAPLVFFRLVFGLLMAIESIGAIFIGFVHEAYIEPQFHFSYLLFHWIEPLPGQGMVYLYILMTILSLMIMAGWWYRTACALFFICFSYGFLIEKAHYINHHYLAILISFVLIFLPANRYFSLDVKFNPSLKQKVIPYWPVFLLASQMAVVYIFGGFAKVNPDWLAALSIKHWFSFKTDYFIIGPLLGLDISPWIFAYGGVLFDLLIVPAMIWSRTRMTAFFIAIFFHFLNLVVFHIGIFPFMAIALTALYFPASSFRKWMFPSTEPVRLTDYQTAVNFSRPALMFCILWLIIQVAVPLRPYFYNEDPQWTEKGHRFAWRMMLRAKSGHITFFVDTEDDTKTIVPSDYLTSSQARNVPTRPDMVYQMGHFLKQHYIEKGEVVTAVRAEGHLSLNGRDAMPFIDPSYDLTEEPWQKCSLPEWVITREKMQ